MNPLLRNAIILDTETTSLRRGAGIHELALYEMQSKQLTEYILDPNLISVTPHTPQDIAGFVGSSKDIHKRVAVSQWQEAIVKEILAHTGIQGNEQAAMEALRWQNPFLYKALKEQVYPHLAGNAEVNAERASRFSRYGIQSNLGKRAAIQDVLASDLPQHLKGKTVWIANAVFESKQIGSQLAADDTATEFKRRLGLETYNVHNPDPFYVTGEQVNKARVSAQLTGDWRQVYQAYKQYTPAAGETAVRDIQDVLRAVMSYGREAKLLKGGSHYFGTGIDVSHKLMAMAAGDTGRAAFAEVHRAAEDAAIHEAYVLEKSVQYAEILSAVEAGTPEGLAYKAAAAQGQGPLAEIGRYFSLLEQAGPSLQKANLLKRLGRAYEDLQTTGRTIQTTGPSGFYMMKQQTASGDLAKIARTEYSTRTFTDMDSLVKHLMHTGEYSDFGINVQAEAEAFRAAAKDLPSASIYVDEGAKAALSQIDGRLLAKSTRLETAFSRQSAVLDTVFSGAKRIGLKGVLGGAAVLTAAGAAWSLIQEKPKDQSSLLGYNYYDWLQAQEGMVNQGLAKENRSKNTDFGSPYRGPVVSNEVFADQEMLAERERWLRSQYGARHYDPMTGIFASLGDFRTRSGYDFIGAGEKVSDGYQGMRGNNLVALNLDDGWKISVEDADTITVRKGGVRGAIQQFFGLNRGYSFRLAGIDAPEVAHGDRGAQPYAMQAKAALESMMANRSIELVFDPMNTTYGRPMAGIIADGQNLNYEMVKRGNVAHLPFGKIEDSIIDYSAMGRAEKQAFGANRGLWSTPWGQAIFNITEGEQRPTFNTLANVAKVVPNSSQMSLVAIANAAQAQGSYTPYAKSGEAVDLTIGSDRVGPTYFDQPVSNTKQYMVELMADTDQFMKTHGGQTQNKFSRRSGYGKLDHGLALDSMGTTNSVWTRRRYGAFDVYRTSEALRNQRMQYMAERQRTINQNMFQSPIGHHRM